MQPIYLSIQQEETGAQIRKLMMKNGYTVRDVQGAMGFENPQAKMCIRDRAMKGFNTSDGYMGLVGGKYILFASEDDYYEYMND